MFLKIKKKILSHLLLRTVFFSLGQSISSYDLEIWTGTYNMHLQNPQILITTNSIIKISLHIPRLYHTIHLYKKFKVFNIKALNFKNVLLHLLKTDVNIFNDVSFL